MSWKKIPLAYRIALVLQLVSIAGWITNALVNTHYKQFARILLAEAGVGMIIKVMAAAGMHDLARMRVGRAAIGARIAFGGIVATLVLELAWAVISSKMSWMEHRTLTQVLAYTWNASALATVVGLAIATDRLALGIAGIVLGFVAIPPDFVSRPVYEALGLGEQTRHYVEMGLQVLHTLVLLVLAAAAARGEPAGNDTARAADGFRRASRALWVRVLAAAIVPVLTLFAIGGHMDSAQSTLKYAVFVAAVVNVLSLLQFAIGILQVARARVTDMTTWVLLVASACALWEAGYLLAQTPELLRALLSDEESYLRRMAQDYVEAWSIVAPLVAIASIALVVGAIAGFAGRRMHNDLHTEASGKGVGYVILMLVAMAMQLWLLPSSRSDGGLVFLTFAALVCLVWGAAMMANLCTRAADAVESEPGLPTAKLL